MHLAGHSLGGALATLLCCFARLKLDQPPERLSCHTFGSPPALISPTSLDPQQVQGFGVIDTNGCSCLHLYYSRTGAERYKDMCRLATSVQNHVRGRLHMGLSRSSLHAPLVLLARYVQPISLGGSLFWAVLIKEHLPLQSPW